MNNVSIVNLTPEERDRAYQKYQLIEPYLNNNCSLKSISKKSNIPLRTLTSWVKKYKRDGLLTLARQSRKDKGMLRKLNQEMVKLTEALYLEYPASSCANIYRLLSSYCEKNKITVPSYRNICKIISLIPDDITTLSHFGSKAYKQKYDLLCIRESERPNQIWQADHVLMDIDVLNHTNNLQRPWLTIIIDDCSRAVCGYELSFLSPSSNKTSLCLRHAIWRKSDPQWPIFGIPEIFYTDHGSDFTSKHIEQVCADLKIQIIHSQIGQPRGRGKIERFFRTLNQKLLSNLAMILQNKKSTYSITLKQLDQMVYKFIVEYNNSIHSEISMKPIDRWEKDCFLPQIPESLEHLDLLLLTEAKPRMIRRDGIHFQGLRYFDIVLAEYVSKTVVIRYTPSDITSIRVFYNGNFLCQPICSELANKTVSIKEIQYARNKRRTSLKKKVKEQKSLIDAVILSSRKTLDFIDNEDELIQPQKPVINKIKLYRNE
jgi:putative transposase